MSVEIRQIDPFAHRDAAFRVYCDSLGVDRFSDAAREWRDTILPRHAMRADFDSRAAVDTDDGIVGFVYGYTGAFGQWWLDTLLEHQPNDRALLSMDPQSATAGPFYRKHGWRTISTWADEAGEKLVLGKDNLK